MSKISFPFSSKDRGAPQRTSVTATVVAAIALLGGMLASGTVLARDTITCESVGRTEQFCRTDTSGGVVLTTQLSSAACQRGSTWGYDRRGIWVANGCRAVFSTGTRHHDDEDHETDAAAAAVAGIALLALGAVAAHEAHDDHHSSDEDYYRYNDSDGYEHHTSRYSRNEVISCESHGNAYNYCKANIRNRHVRILHVLSNHSCRFHEDWGYNKGGIWVENGCRATFEIEN